LPPRTGQPTNRPSRADRPAVAARACARWARCRAAGARHLEAGHALAEGGGQRLGQALGAVEDDHLVDRRERLGRGLDDRRPLLGQLLADDRVLVLGKGVGPCLDRLGLGHALGLDGLALGPALGRRRGRLGLADQPGRLGAGDGVDADPLGLGDRLQPDPLGRRLGVQLDLLALGLGPGDAGVAGRLGQGDRLIGLGVGRLADGGLEALLLALGLQLGHLGLLDDHVLAGRGVGQRPGLLGLGGGLVDLGLVAGLLDHALAPGLGLEGVGALLGGGRLPVGVGLGDARLPGHGGGVGQGQVPDVAGRVVDLLDLEGVDDQAELLHLRPRRLAGQRGQLLPVPDHLLDRHVADDGPQVAGEHVVDPGVHLLLLVEEAAGGVGDRDVVVADLEDDHALDPERDALVGHALDRQRGLAQVERQPPDRLDARQHQRALAGDDAEAHALAGPLGRRVLAQAGDDQGLVGLGDPPHELEDREQDDQADDDAPGQDQGVHCFAFRRSPTSG
jgi:hypothetical protein